MFFSKILMPFEKVSSGSWLVLVYPKGVDRKPSDCVLSHKFPVQKFKIQQMFIGTRGFHEISTFTISRPFVRCLH